MDPKSPAKPSQNRPIKEKAQQRAIFPDLSAIVLSPLQCLTSVFGMGTGVTTAPMPPDFFFYSMFFEYWILLVNKFFYLNM